MPAYSFDPVAASSLLDAAGYRIAQADRTKAPARFRFTCLLPEDFPVWEKAALEVQRDLFNVGVDMQFNVVTLDEFSTLVFADAYPDIEKSGNYVFVQRPSGDRGGTVINVFAIGASGRY